MFENRINPFDKFETPEGSTSRNAYAHQYNAALSRFKSSLVMGRVSRLKNRIMHLPQWLYDLNLLNPGLSLRSSFYSGIQVVPIGSIIGSEGKAAHFDMGFHPIKEASRERWVSLAMAYIGCLPLPPVELIQIDDVYFVRDGHHRISVSRALWLLVFKPDIYILFRHDCRYRMFINKLLCSILQYYHEVVKTLDNPL